MKKQITKKHPEGFIRINLSTERNYFSITGDIHSRDSFSDGSFILGGCIHEEILEVSPELKPFVALHLSDLRGVPMHAVENGFYWLCKAAGIPQEYAPEQDAETCFTYLYKHLRTGYDETKFIVEAIKIVYEEGTKKIASSEEVTAKCREEQHKQGIFDAKNAFKKIVDSMKERWQNEAERAIKQLEKMP